MKIKFSTVRNVIISLLMLILGLMVGLHHEEKVRRMTPFLFSQQTTVKPSSQINGQVVPPADKGELNFDVFWEVWGLLERDYLNPEDLQANDMVNGAIRGMTKAVGDPYTIYLPPQDNKRSGENLQGSFYGVGIELGYIEKTLAIIAPLDGTPAAQAGLEAGDLILHVTDETKDLDEDTIDWSLEEAVNKIRGKKGVPITFTIYRENNGGEPFDVTVKRDEIVIETVKLEMQDYQGFNLAHLRLSRFGGRTQQEWDQAVAKILNAQPAVDGIVLDMRNNPGGYFDTSIELASDFIERGTVVSQKSRYSTENYSAVGQARLKDYSLVVLVNKGSASAAEIVAGALRDDLGIKLVGQQTFGKGTVQDRKEVSNGGGVHITVGRWLLPKGDWIHDEGIPVDVEVEQNRETEEDEVLQRGMQILTDSI